MAIIEVSSGQTSTGIILNNNNAMIVTNGGTANSTTINSGGNLSISSGGKANSTTVNSSGILFVHSGGTANIIAVQPGGRMTIYSGGTATQVLENGGAIEVDDDARITFVPNTLSGLTFSAFATVHSGTTAQCSCRIAWFRNSRTSESKRSRSLLQYRPCLSPFAPRFSYYPLPLASLRYQMYRTRANEFTKERLRPQRSVDTSRPIPRNEKNMKKA